jgi:hypothetical protein
MLPELSDGIVIMEWNCQYDWPGDVGTVDITFRLLGARSIDATLDE